MPEQAVAVLVRQLARLGVDGLVVLRAGPGGSVTALAGHPEPSGAPWTPGPDDVTGRALASGEVEIEPGGSRAAIPVTVAGELWGVVELRSGPASFPSDRLDSAVALIEVTAVAIGWAQRCAELDASRLRLMAEVDSAFLRIERELHDGVQQRLVTTGMELRLLQTEMPPGDPAAAALAEIGDQLGDMSAGVRELSRRTFPAILSDGGLGPALRSLARRSALPVELDLSALPRYPPLAEVTAYQVVATVVEHAVRAGASHVSVRAADLAGRLRLVVTDDGAGDDEDVLSPVVRDRLDALGAGLELRAGPDGGVVVAVDFRVAGG